MGWWLGLWHRLGKRMECCGPACCVCLLASSAGRRPRSAACVKLRCRCKSSWAAPCAMCSCMCHHCAGVTIVIIAIPCITVEHATTEWVFRKFEVGTRTSVCEAGSYADVWAEQIAFILVWRAAGHIRKRLLARC